MKTRKIYVTLNNNAIEAHTSSVCICVTVPVFLKSNSTPKNYSNTHFEKKKRREDSSSGY